MHLREKDRVLPAISLSKALVPLFPSLSWCKNKLSSYRWQPFSPIIISGYIVGSFARPDKEIHQNSDIDILLEIKEIPGVTVNQLHDWYHFQYKEPVPFEPRLLDYPRWRGRWVDFSFLYENEPIIYILDKIQIF